MTHTIGMISLGCAKNQVNAEHMLWLLRQAGYEISPDPDGAELVIVNTCGFIESAKTEAIDNILAMAQLKAEGRIQKILVTGCLAQRYQEEILKELPEVDGVLGTGSYYDVANAVGQVLSGKRYKRFDDINAEQPEDGRILTTPEYYAYLKIAEGCDNHCAYCIIPKIRGGFRSKPMEAVVAEAEELAAAGCKELILIAQDVTNYGRDLYGEPRLAELVREVCKVGGIQWVRLMYCYEDRITDELIEVMAAEPKVCHYIDIPIQHASDSVLKAMRRRSTEESIKNTIERLKAAIPDIHIRTTLIVGFPGETEEDFETLLDFVEEMRFARLGVFAYSQEESTEAGEMDNQIEEDVKQERLDAIMRRQLDISLEYNREKVGKEFTVLVEEKDEDGSYIGRTQYDAPEIDNSVIFTSNRNLKAGDMVQVIVEDAFDYDLVGREV